MESWKDTIQLHLHQKNSFQELKPVEWSIVHSLAEKTNILPEFNKARKGFIFLLVLAFFKKIYILNVYFLKNNYGFYRRN